MSEPGFVMRASPHLPIGLRLDHYRIESVLGVGGSGVTYRAFDLQRQRAVAIKEYFPKLWAARADSGNVEVANPRYETEFRWGLDRFIAEAETLARFRHEGIVKVERVFGAMGTALMQLEYIVGPNLELWAAQSRARPAQAELDAFAEALLAALAVIHRAGVLHRDIAPRNILLDRQGLPVVIDFGSARQDIVAMSAAPTLLVTPHYAGQEQYIASGAQQGPWTDIYSAAAVLWFLVAGSPPPAAPARAVDAARLRLRSMRGMDRYRPAFLQAIEWGLEFLPRDRPQAIPAWEVHLLGHAGTGPRDGLRHGLRKPEGVR